MRARRLQSPFPTENPCTLHPASCALHPAPCTLISYLKPQTRNTKHGSQYVRLKPLCLLSQGCVVVGIIAALGPNTPVYGIPWKSTNLKFLSLLAQGGVVVGCIAALAYTRRAVRALQQVPPPSPRRLRYALKPVELYTPDSLHLLSTPTLQTYTPPALYTYSLHLYTPYTFSPKPLRGQIPLHLYPTPTPKTLNPPTARAPHQPPPGCRYRRVEVDAPRCCQRPGGGPPSGKVSGLGGGGERVMGPGDIPEVGVDGRGYSSGGF